MFRVILNKIEKYFELRNDPMLKDLSKGATYDKYGFSVGKYTYGYEKFFYKGVNLKEIGSFFQ